MKDFIKEKVREGLNKNILGVEVTRPNNVLYIMNGVSGGGKSTKAKELVKSGVIHSTDDLIEATGDYRGFFEKMKETNNFSPLHKMHQQNLSNAKKSIDVKITPVVIDNTNLKPSEPRDYVLYALNSGYSDDNIKFVNIGTGGLSVEELAKRNTHSVPYDKIKQMVDTYNSVGPLTLEKVLNIKSLNEVKIKNILYSAVVLDPESHKKLINLINDFFILDDWKILAHHMTITFGKGLPDNLKNRLGDKVTLKAIEFGQSDKAIAVKVEGFPSDNIIPHITIAVNTGIGAKPVDSNSITNWVPLKEPINLTGTITEIKNN